MREFIAWLADTAPALPAAGRATSEGRSWAGAVESGGTEAVLIPLVISEAECPA